MSKTPNQLPKSKNIHFIEGTSFSITQTTTSNNNKTTKALSIPMIHQTKIKNNKIKRMDNKTLLKITIKKGNSSKFVFDFSTLEELISHLNEEDHSEDEGIEDYKIGGYHPCHVG
jgi:hypothetical protein